MPAADADCFVCRKQRGEVFVPGGTVYRDDLVYASHGIIDEGKTQAYLGTLFLEPRRHAPGFEDLTDPEAERMGVVAARLSRALRKTEGAEHVYAYKLGDHVDHLHLWIVPRYPGTPREFWPMRLGAWPEAPCGDAAEIAALCDRVRACLARDPQE